MSVVIAGYARTPFAKFNGALASLSATELGSIAISAALNQAQLSPEDVQYVVAGQVLQAGAGQNPGRQSARGANIPFTSPAITLNVVCLSGTEAIAAGAGLIRRGAADVVVAVGQESMSNAPHAMPHSRVGKKYGSLELLDTLEIDGLTDAFEKRSMGVSTEEGNVAFTISREEQDHVAVASHQRASAAREYLRGEIVPVTLSQRGTEVVVMDDDGVRDETTMESLARLRSAFGADGTITAGNSSQISDGAAAVVLTSEDFATQRGIRWLARLVSHSLVAGPDVRLHYQPASAIDDALTKAELAREDLSVVEINEAFASVAVHSSNLLGLDLSIVNKNGGAIALGHPIGASGVRIAGHLARQLSDLGGGAYGAVGICGGGGQGSALIFEAPAT